MVPKRIVDGVSCPLLELVRFFWLLLLLSEGGGVAEGIFNNNTIGNGGANRNAAPAAPEPYGEDKNSRSRSRAEDGTTLWKNGRDGENREPSRRESASGIPAAGAAQTRIPTPMSRNSKPKRVGGQPPPPPPPSRPLPKGCATTKKKDEEIKEKRRENKKSESSRVLSLKLSLEVSMTFEIGLGFSLCSFSTKWKRRTSFDGLAAARVCRYLFLLYLVFFSLHIRHHGRL